MPGGIRLSVEELSGKDFITNQLEIEVTVRGTGPITYESSSDQDRVKMMDNWTKSQFIDEVLLTVGVWIGNFNGEPLSSSEEFNAGARNEMCTLWLLADS